MGEGVGPTSAGSLWNVPGGSEPDPAMFALIAGRGVERSIVMTARNDRSR